MAGNPTNNVSARRRGDPPPAAARTRPRPHLLHPLRRRGRSVSSVPPASSSRAVLPRPARQVGHPVLRRVRGDRAAPRRGVARRVRLLLVGGLQERQAASSVPPPRRRGVPPPGRGAVRVGGFVWLRVGRCLRGAHVRCTVRWRGDVKIAARPRRTPHPKLTPMSRHRGVLCAVADRAMFPALLRLLRVLGL